MAKGKLVVFEGIDNCGKDTIISHIKYELTRKSKLVKVIPSVSDTQLGRLIRLITTNKSEMRPNNFQLVPMFVADFYSKLDLIEEYMDMGYIVLCNRWYSTTLAYCDQTTDKTAIKNLIRTNIKPDLFLYLQITVDESINREKGYRKIPDVYSNRPMLEQAKSVYDKLFIKNNEFNATTINANLPIKFVMDYVKNELEDGGIVDEIGR